MSFDEAWEYYPRKIAKTAARKSYLARIKQGVTDKELLLATQNYALSQEGKDMKYTLHGSTFYGASERWKDYLVGVIDPDDWMGASWRNGGARH